MTIINTYRAESWDKIYSAFDQVNFSAFDFDTIKESLIQYIKIYFPEDFNDMIESSELITIIESFAYATEILAYRIDVNAHENFLSTAQRKQSVLRLAKLVSYSATRNIPARGLVKINTISTTETVFDSLGNNLANLTITWNDPNNTNWKEQFFIVMNLVLNTHFGQPSLSKQIADVLLQQYTFKNIPSAFKNGVFSFSAASNTSTVPVEIVPLNIDDNGPFERAPSINSQLSLCYASDGRGDSSDYTGFLLFLKQGNLILTQYNMQESVSNRRILLNLLNVNDIDVWLARIDSSGTILERWTEVPTLVDQSLAFNTLKSRKKYEIETLENDQIAFKFGDGNFSDIPVGNFAMWTRTSANDNIVIPKASIANQQCSFPYLNTQNIRNTCSLTFSLTSTLQNNAPSETLEHIRQTAPSTYYAQNRMVNGQDYNTFMLTDPTILKLNTINRTFAGQPKYIDWNDASGMYQNIKLFGDDLSLSLETNVDLVQTATSSKNLIDNFIEPKLGSAALLNVLTHQAAYSPDAYGIVSYPRRYFIEDNRKRYKDVDGNFITPYGRSLSNTPLQIGDGSLLEKTMIQGALDSHWYGEPLSTVTINGAISGVIPDPVLTPTSNGKVYVSNLPRTVDGVNIYPPGDLGSGTQPIIRQTFFGLKYNRFLQGIGTGTISLFDAGVSIVHNECLGTAAAVGLNSYFYKTETLTIEMLSDGNTFTVKSNLRGALPNYSLIKAASTLMGKWSEQLPIDTILPADFAITIGNTHYDTGDCFIIDINNDTPQPRYPENASWYAKVRTFGSDPENKNTVCVNLNGWWELIPQDVVTGAIVYDADGFPSGGLGLFSRGANNGPNELQAMKFDSSIKGNAWTFLISRSDDTTGEVQNWNIYNRDMKIIASSNTTNFWFNQTSQIIDSETLMPVYDKIRILRSNIDSDGYAMKKADLYDCIDSVYDSNGIIIPKSLEVLPAGLQDLAQTSHPIAINLLQFEDFSKNSFDYYLVDISNPSNPIASPFKLRASTYTTVIGYDILPYNLLPYDSASFESSSWFVINTNSNGIFIFRPGDFLSNVNGIYQLIRKIKVPATTTFSPITGQYGSNAITGLDFMWQHFTPDANLIDPSVSNIHDTYILTSGYYSQVLNYIKGFVTTLPPTPTPLDLRTSYGYLLANKMLSDTVVLHAGRVKMLFGDKADLKFRAKFRVVISSTATLSGEQIKSEIINVVNTYFSISDWDFGDTFYATELLSLIHQALATQISSVVLVPVYSINSFGSLFTIESGLDEILQSCALVSDVEIVQALTPAVLRQIV